MTTPKITTVAQQFLDKHDLTAERRELVLQRAAQTAKGQTILLHDIADALAELAEGSVGAA